MRSSLLLVASLALLALCAAYAAPASAAPSVPSDVRVFDVTEYGAVGDGKTDDSQAVYKAGQVMEQCNCAATLYFPKGNYLLTAPASGVAGDPFVDLQTPGQWGLIGDGIEETVIHWQSMAGQFLNVQVPEEAAAAAAVSTSFVLGNLSVLVEPIPPDWEAQYNVFNLQGSGDDVQVNNVHIQWQPRSASVGFYVVRAATLTVNDVISLGPGEGFMIQECSNVLVSDVTIMGEAGAANQPTGIELDVSGDNIVLQRLSMSNAYQGLYVFLFPFLSAGDVQNVQLSDSVFQDCDFGVDVATNVTLQVDNVLFNSTASAAGRHANRTAILIEDFHYSAASVSVSRSHFGGMTTAIDQTGGRVSVKSNGFSGVAVGLRYTAPAGPVAAGFDVEPFALQANSFDALSTQQTPVITASPARGFVVEDNVCTGSTTAMHLLCTGGCTVTNNLGC